VAQWLEGMLTQDAALATVASEIRTLTRQSFSAVDMNIFQLEEAFVKTIISDTVETYPGQWRLVHEALQNAHDHIQLNRNISKGLIEIHLLVGSNTVMVKDNGTGIDIRKFYNIFHIGGTDKADLSLKKLLKGSQGVGIKSTLFTSEFFRVETVHNGYAWDYELKDCHNFKNPEFSPDLEPPATKPSNLPSGSTFTYSLSDYTVQEFLNEVVREYCEDTRVDPATHKIATTEDLKTVLETYFRTRTYLGCTQAMLGLNSALKPVEVKVVLSFDSNDPKAYQGIDLNYCQFFAEENLYGSQISQTFPAKYIDALEIHGTIHKHERANRVFQDFKEVLNNPPDETIKKLLIQKLDRDAVRSLLSTTKRNAQTRLLEFKDDPVRLKRHRAALDTINGMYIVVGQKSYLQKYFHMGARQNISVNGLPTNISLNVPSSATAYISNIHLVLDVNCTLGFGKRNLPSRTKGSLDTFYLEAWNMLRRVIPLIVGQREGIDPADLIKWDKFEEFEHYKDSSNRFRESRLLFKCTPKEEQEVIALFFELIGRGDLKGYFPFRVGGKTIYDGLFYLDKNEGDVIPQNIKASQLRQIEFKSCLSRLIQDLDDEKKFLAEIDLLVCWNNDIQDDALSDYSIHSLERDNIDPYPGAQLRIQRKTDYCQVLVLKDYLESKNLISTGE
jgi:hypothetical protein